MRKKLKLQKEFRGGRYKTFYLQSTPKITNDRIISSNTDDDDENDGNDWWESDTVIIQQDKKVAPYGATSCILFFSLKPI